LDPVNFDEYSKMVEKILQIPMIVFELTRNLSALPMILPEMIESGLIWKAIQHMFFSLTPDSKNFESFINQILTDASLTLLKTCSFAKNCVEKTKKMPFMDLLEESGKL